MSDVHEETVPWNAALDAAIFAEADLCREHLVAVKNQTSISDFLFYATMRKFRVYNLPNVMKLFEQVCKANISTVTFFATADSEHVRITLGNIPAGISVREWLTLLSDRLSELDSDVLYKLDGFLNIYHYQLECSLEFNSGLC